MMNYKSTEILLNYKLKNTNVIITRYRSNHIKNYSNPVNVLKIRKVLIIYNLFKDKINNIKLNNDEINDLNILKDACNKLYENILDENESLYIMFDNHKIYKLFNYIENYLNNELLNKNKLLKYVIGDIK